MARKHQTNSLEESLDWYIHCKTWILAINRSYRFHQFHGMLQALSWGQGILNLIMILLAHINQWFAFGESSKGISNLLNHRWFKFQYMFLKIELRQLFELPSKKAISLCCGDVYWRSITLWFFEERRPIIRKDYCWWLLP